MRAERCSNCGPGLDATGLCGACLRRHVEALRAKVSDHGGFMAALDARLTLLEDAFYALQQSIERRTKAISTATLETKP
jgi:hypothetical protein